MDRSTLRNILLLGNQGAGMRLQAYRSGTSDKQPQRCLSVLLASFIKLTWKIQEHRHRAKSQNCHGIEHGPRVTLWAGTGRAMQELIILTMTLYIPGTPYDLQGAFV